MAGQINYFKDRVDWEGTAIEKLTCSPDIPVNNRIFALGRCAFTDEALFCRIWSFECFPEDKASLSWVIKNDRGEVLTARAYRNGEASLIINGEAKDELSTYLITGEDLQGEYWGAVFTVPLKPVLDFLGKDALTPGDKVYMEFNKDGENLSSFADYFKVMH